MENYKKYLIGFGLILLFVLISPIFFAWLNIVLSPYLSTASFAIIIFATTVVIAWYGKIGRK